MLANLFEGMSTESSLQAILQVLIAMHEKMPRLDVNDRMTINAESGNGISVSLNSAQTLATVTNVTTLANMTNLGTTTANGIPYHIANLGAAHIYNNIVVS